MFSAQSPTLDPTVLLAPCHGHGSTTRQMEEPMLSFDDVLEIAREYERTAHGSVHIFEPQEPRVCSAMTLEHILAAIIPTGAFDEGSDNDRVEKSAQPISTPVHPETWKSPWLEVFDVCQPHPHLHALSTHEAEASTLTPNDTEARIKPGDKSTPTLLGWTPPNGSQVLDLDPNLELPELDSWYPPWLAKLLAPSAPGQHTQPEVHSLTTLSKTGGAQPEKFVGPPTRTGKVVEKHRETVPPPPPPPAQLPPTRVVLASIQARTSSGTNGNAPGQTSTASHSKSSRSRPHPSSFMAATATTRTYASAPRGGIPPHLARTVTKANILRAEEERERIRAAVSSGSVGEGRKPSVLATVGKVERGARGNSTGGGGGKKVFDRGGDREREGGRALKRTKVCMLDSVS
ncbi:hypothetical protein BS17DRAFT_779469 [Gyrodon lividus]|nr:hypothetical protein BS17DRAFT_779469 [Gyrodon lividus]